MPSAPEPAAVAAELARRLRALGGARTDVIRRLRREYSKHLAKATPRAIVRVAIALIGRPGHPHRFVAYELVHHHRPARASLGARELERLGRGIASWDQVDTFALYLAGPAWRERQIPDALVQRWARSRDRWWRRTALVSTVALNSRARDGHGDSRRTLRICALLVGDRDDMVVKAMSWALRELAKRDPESARAFIAAHEEALAPRVLREVRNKLTTGLKNPRRTKVAGTARRG